MKKHFLLLFFSSFQLFLFAGVGKSPAQWGKFNKDELAMKTYKIDSSASAVILVKFGTVSFEVVGGELRTIYECLIRIKILDKAGFKYSDVNIPYIAKDNTDRFMELKAHTINTDIEGKIIETNVSKDLFLDEDMDGFYHQRKFAFPDLRIGSILEYYYKIRSDEIRFLKSWKFQNDIPIVHCEYQTYIPEIFNYTVMTSAKEGMSKVEHDNTFMNLNNKMNAVTRIDVDITSYIMSNVIAIHEEPYSINPVTYGKLSMQLNAIISPGEVTKTILKDWDDFGTYVREALWLGDQHRQYSFAKDIAEQLTANETNPRKKVTLIYDYVKNHISWNNNYDLYIDDLKTSFKNSTGNGTEVNSILLCILRSAGIDADPVYVSTRDHGEIKKAFTFLNQFNHMVVRTKIDDEDLILDATDSFRPITLQNKDNLNTTGFVLQPHNFSWINISKVPNTKCSTSFFLNLDKEDNLKGKVSYSCNNYEGLYGRRRISKVGLNDFFSDLLNEKELNIKSDSTLVENLDSLNNSLIIKSNITAPVSSGDQFIYITPFINSDLHVNPFIDEVRQSPVEFYYPETSISNLIIQIPEGYKISELPKSIKVTLPDSAASFTFISSASNNMVQLKSTLSIEKLYYPVEEYADVREFFSNISKKYSEQIVISKQ